MPRNMSFSMTTEQSLNRPKTVENLSQKSSSFAGINCFNLECPFWDDSGKYNQISTGPPQRPQSSTVQVHNAIISGHR